MGIDNSYRKLVLVKTRKIAHQLERAWPEIQTRITLDTREGEDAYLWIVMPEHLEDEVLDEATGLTVDLYNEEGIYVMAMPERQQVGSA